MTPGSESGNTGGGAEQFALIQAGLDHIDQGITIFDAALTLVGWNRKFFELLEFPLDLARPGTPFAAFIRYNAGRGEYGDGDTEEQVARRVAAASRFDPHYLERIRPNGRIIAIRGEPLPGRGFVTVYTDVTEQRRREQRIEGEKVVLESRLHLITDAVPALIAYIDRDRRYSFANKGYAAWFGYTKTGIIGKPLAEVLGPDLHARLAPQIARALAGETVTYEYTHRSPEGVTVYARSTLVPERTDAGEVAGLFVLSVDITEQRKAQAALIQAQKMEAVGQLTGGLAHDFNNLLTIILGNLSTLAQRCDGSQAELIEPALSAARRGAELTRRLLAFARRQPLEPQVVEVDSLVANMVRLLRRSLSGQVEIVLATSGKPLFALVDPSQLENALLNLALNSRDAMPGGGRLTIETRDVTIPAGEEVPPGDYVRVAVRDTGSGMDAETLARAFEPFFTRKGPGGGSGLGLSMVYGFVKQSGGDIRLHSRLGEGATVTILLPSVPPPDDTELAQTVTSGAGAPTRFVLLVEDDADVRGVIRRLLIGLGHRVVEAADAAEALQLIDAVPELEVLLTDVVMPGEIDGVALAHRARSLRPGLTIALVSGHVGDRTSAAGFPLLRKPFTPEELAAVVGG
jgi:PAS domain S-box-containing protein